MKKTKTLLIISCLFLILPSCVFTHLEEGLGALKGKPIATAFSVLGYPDSQQVFGQDTVYVWSTGFRGSSTVPRTATTTGYIGTTPVSGTTTYLETETTDYFCKIKLAVGPDGRIKQTNYSGNVGGCIGCAGKLKAYADSQKTE